MNPIARAWFEACEAPDVGGIVEWAERHVELPLGYVPPGRFDSKGSRHLLAPLEALHPSSRYRMVNVLKGTQTGGTLIGDIFVPWTVCNAPGPIMWNWHTGELAKQHAESRAMPVMTKCQPVARLFSDDRYKSRTQEVGFRNGVWCYIQGPSDANLQGKSIRYLINDEVWQWKPGRIREAFARVTQYYKIGTSKVLNISQGSQQGDDWWTICEDAEQFDWEVPCSKCGQFFRPRFDEVVAGRRVFRMKWHPGGNHIRLECGSCGFEMEDSDRLKREWNDAGRYVRTNGNVVSENATFHWNSLIWLPWKKLVDQYIGATRAMTKGSLLPLREFVQKVMADFWNEQDVLEDASVDVEVGDYDPSPAKGSWPEERFRFLSVDCQRDLAEFWAVVRAWSAKGESRLLAARRLGSFHEVEALQKEFGLPSKFVALDSAYESTKVYRECCKRVEANGRGWICLLGSDRMEFTHVVDGKKDFRLYSEKVLCNPAIGLKSKEMTEWLSKISAHAMKIYKRGALRCRRYSWANPPIKDITANLRDGKGVSWLSPAVGIADDMSITYRKHMASEVKRKRIVRLGEEVEEYVKIGPNHLLDCERMQTVLALMAGVLDISGREEEPAKPELPLRISIGSEPAESPTGQ